MNAKTKSARRVKGGCIVLSRDAVDSWSVNIYKKISPNRRGSKFGEWKSGRVFESNDAAVAYFNECVKSAGEDANDYFKFAQPYRFEVTRGTADKLWYFRVMGTDHLWSAWTGGYETKAMAVTKATAKCSRDNPAKEATFTS